MFAAPGDRLGVIEEFVSGPGTYVEGGVIYSSVAGLTLLDTPNRKISIHPSVHKVAIPSPGSIVIGQVSDVQNKMAAVQISQIEAASPSGSFNGTLHVSDSSYGYVDTMFDVCQPGDIIRAKVIIHQNRTYHLSTVEKNLGVIYAFCTRCGHMLLLERQRMRCQNCGKTERRKVASEYGKNVQ